MGLWPVKWSPFSHESEGAICLESQKTEVRAGDFTGKATADAEVDRAYVSELERKRGNASLDLMDKLAVVLGISLAEFFQQPEAGAKQPKPLRSGRPARK